MYLIIDTAKLPNNPTTAHARLAKKLSYILDADLISTKEEAESLEIDKYKYFLIVGSAFYPETAAIEAILKQNKNAIPVWVNNEYNCAPNSEYNRLLKDRNGIVISNVVEKANKITGYSGFYLINLNCLLFDTINRPITKKYNCLYYGTWRPGRRLYLQEYFQQNDFYLSSSKKNLRKFKFLGGCKAIWCDRLDWSSGQESLNLFKYSLYVEDEYTHTHYNHLANRFYESLMCNVVQYFDINCMNTLTFSQYPFDPWFFVRNYKELKIKIKSIETEEYLDLLKRQSDLWTSIVIKEKVKVESHLKKILS